MSNVTTLILITVLAPAIAFGLAFLLVRAIGLSTSPRRSRLIGLATAGVIWSAVVVFTFVTHGFGRQSLVQRASATLFTWVGWLQFRRSFPPASVSPPPAA